MCGIVSILGPPGAADEEVLRKATATLRHRGPDGEGVWTDPRRSAGLGHTRLSIIDPATGAQPILSEDGQICLAVNGEFYGFEAIRADLQRRGHRFRTGSDSEIALHLYEEWGIRCLARLRGEFAFALYDGREGLLFAARDRFGIKPLCYSVMGETLLLASEAKALFAAGVTPVWDREAFFHAAGMQYLPPGRTLFAGVAQLPPGHYLLARPGEVLVRRYWDLDYPLPGETFPEEDEEALAQGLRERLAEALRLRLRADVPVCFHLSGGLDSSSLAGLARRLGHPAPCFTVSFEEEGYDELAVARQTADHLGVNLHVVPVRQADVVEHLADAVYFSEGLAINGHLSAKFLLSRAIHEAGYKAVLSGEGSDEVLIGYPHLRRDLLGESPADLLRDNPIMAGIQLAEGESLPLDAVRSALGFVPGFLEAKGTLGRRMRGLLSRDFLAEFAGRDPYRDLLASVDVEGQLAGRQRVDQASYLWTKLSLAGYILRTLGDGTEMAHSVEGRLPFLDHHLFAFLRRVPAGLKVRGGVEKYLLRKAARDVLTDTVFQRRKLAFTAPPLSRFSSPALDGYLRDVLGGPALSGPGFFDAGRVRGLLDRLPAMSDRERVAADPVLMLVLTAVLAHQRFRLSSASR